MTKLTDRLQNKRWDDDENVDHEFTRDELDALWEMANNLSLNNIWLEGMVGGPHPDELVTVQMVIGDKVVKFDAVKNADAQELWELLTHLSDLILWAKQQAKF
jgi:hypothetical protein